MSDEQPQAKPCLGHHMEDPGLCYDCEIAKICQAVSEKFIVRSEVVALIDEVLNEVEA